MKTFNRKTKGFSLVELLVVIAIIGILMTIFGFRLNTTRNKGKDAAIKIALLEIRNAAGLYKYPLSQDSYDGVCDDSDETLSNDGDFGKIEESIINNGGRVKCKDAVTAYAVISSLNLGDCWCVDSQGNSKKVEISGSETCEDKLTETFCP